MTLSMVFIVEAATNKRSLVFLNLENAISKTFCLCGPNTVIVSVIVLSYVLVLLKNEKRFAVECAWKFRRQCN